MPDLHLDAVHAFWDSYDRRTLYRIVVALEHVEHWALDTLPRVEAALLKLGELIDHTADFELTHEEPLIRLLIQTRGPRAFRILQSIDMIKPGSAAQILMRADEISREGSSNQDPYAKLFLRRNLVFERLQLLSRVFAPQRTALILKALEQGLDEE